MIAWTCRKHALSRGSLTKFGQRIDPTPTGRAFWLGHPPA